MLCKGKTSGIFWLSAAALAAGRRGSKSLRPVHFPIGLLMRSISSAPRLSVSRAPRGTLQDHVYRELCELILDGGIAPGQSITIQALANAFGVSAMPVREALQRLSAAHVLTVISGRSIGIPPLSKERMLDLRRVRLEVEALAAEWATARMDAADFRKLEQLLRKAERAADEGDRAYIGLNRAIHFTIYRASGSDVLVAIIENLWLQVSPYFHFLYSSGNPHQAKKIHAQILEGLRNRDADMVRSGLIADIEAAGRVLDAALGADADRRQADNTLNERFRRPGPDEDPWEREIAASLRGRSSVTIATLLEQLGQRPDGLQHATGQRVGRILQSLGWTRAQRRIGGKPVRVYVKPASDR
jgi:DNA-binding GntR family transcriptional regulator